MYIYYIFIIISHCTIVLDFVLLFLEHLNSSEFSKCVKRNIFFRNFLFY